MCDESVKFSTLATRVLKYEKSEEDGNQFVGFRTQRFVI